MATTTRARARNGTRKTRTKTRVRRLTPRPRPSLLTNTTRTHRKTATPVVTRAKPRQSRYWLLAADPAKYHWDTLFVKGKEIWGGVSNPRAQRYLRQVRQGDRAVCYHGTPERSIYALAAVASDSYPDPLRADGKTWAVDLKAVQRVPHSVSLKELRQERRLRRMKFLSQTRLPVSPLTEEEYHEILRVSGVATILPF